jgi:hypothetical protein
VNSPLRKFLKASEHDLYRLMHNPEKKEEKRKEILLR